MEVDELIFLAFNRHVFALLKKSGAIHWQWNAPSGQYFTAILVEDEEVYVSSSGYTYCLDALTGEEIWRNDLKGMGTGIPCLATARQNNQSQSGAAAAVVAEQHAASAGAGAGAAG